MKSKTEKIIEEKTIERIIINRLIEKIIFIDKAKNRIIVILTQENKMINKKESILILIQNLNQNLIHQVLRPLQVKNTAKIK